MQQNSLSIRNSRFLNISGSVFFVALGIYIISAAQTFESLGKVTPVFIGSGMIALSILLIATELFSRRSIPKIENIEGSLMRRIVFVGIMFLWIAFLPNLGFLISSIIAFALISAAVPRNDKWSLSRFGLHSAAGVVTTVGFWLLLTHFLNVPLPEPKIF
jgi:putative tricarboxylic transport membrane protein